MLTPSQLTSLRPRSNLAWCAILALVASACSAAETEADAGAVVDACSPTCSATDTGSAMVDDSGTDDDVPPPPPVYEVGTNVPGETAAQYFTQATEGLTVPGVLGTQGAWMVVVAGRTNQFGCCVDRVDVEARVTALDGTIFGELRYKRRPLFDGGDGLRYLMNTFVVIGDPGKWNGQDVDITLAITPTDGGERLEQTVRVTVQQVTDTAQ